MSADLPHRQLNPIILRSSADFDERDRGDLLDVVALSARKLDALLAELLLGLQLRNDDGALGFALADQLDLLLQDLDLVALAFQRLQGGRARLFAMQPGVGAAQLVDNSPEGGLGLALGQRLRDEKRAQRLLDLHLALGLFGRKSAGKDSVVEPALCFGLGVEVVDLLRRLRCLLGDLLAQEIARLRLDIDPVLDRFSERPATALADLERRIAAAQSGRVSQVRIQSTKGV
jgi:hypothetical protein